MSRIIREIAPSQATNYARNVYTGHLHTFRSYWRPLRPSHWASWKPVAGVPEMHLIGESELFYRLRQRIALGCAQAPGLLSAMHSNDADTDAFQAAHVAASKLTSPVRAVLDEEAND